MFSYMDMRELNALVISVRIGIHVRKWKIPKLCKAIIVCKDVIIFLFDIAKFWYS
jgi:hypothetical protein